jgi:hypothetical protein
VSFGLGFWLGGLAVMGGLAAFSVGVEAASDFGGGASLITFGVFEMLLGGMLLWGDWTAERRG